jgi:hypothetical protein
MGHNLQSGGVPVVGFSLSFCIMHILDGTVKQEDVVHIYTACGKVVNNNEEYRQKVSREYQETYWNDDPRRAEQIFKELTDAGKITHCGSKALVHIWMPWSQFNDEFHGDWYREAVHSAIELNHDLPRPTNEQQEQIWAQHCRV